VYSLYCFNSFKNFDSSVHHQVRKKKVHRLEAKKCVFIEVSVCCLVCLEISTFSLYLLMITKVQLFNVIYLHIMLVANYMCSCINLGQDDTKRILIKL
jgi:hypothetical protein